MNKSVATHIDRLIGQIQFAKSRPADDFEDFADKWIRDVAMIFAEEGNYDAEKRVLSSSVIGATGEGESGVSIVFWKNEAIDDIIIMLQELLKQ